MPPSKGKKSSKPSVTPPPFDRSPFSRTPSTRSRGGGGEEEDEETRLRTLLSVASAKFPSFISETAFIGRVIDVDSSSRYQGGEARVWVSEAAMVSSSLRPGFLVSVSLAASDGTFRDRVPLDGFSDGIARHFGVESVSSESNGAGNYFAIATVFPSRKVMKSDVKLSQCLSCTMGFPTTGKGIFLYPIQSLTKDSDVNGKQSNLTNMDVYKVLLSKCEDLYLKLVRINAALIDHDERTYPRVSSESSHIVGPNGNTLSPRTPLSYLRKLSSPSPSPVSSSRHKESTSNHDTDFDLSAIRMWLKDEKINGMLKVYAARRLCGRYLLEGSFVSFSICGKACMFVVESAGQQVVDGSSHLSTYQGDPVWSHDETQMSSFLESEDAVFIVGNKTKISLFESIPPNLVCSVKENLLADKSTGEDLKKKTMNTLPKLGGLSKEVSILKEIIKFSLTRIDSLPRYKGVLLHGPPGTGKTSLASYCAHGAGANFFSINGPEVVSQYYGESEQALCEVFSSARRAAPAVVFIDELDAIAPARKDGGEELSLRMVATLLSLMDGITETEGVLLVAATNRPDSIDPALRRPGRLDREIEIGVPSPGQRLEILATVLDEMYHSLSDNEIQSLAFATHGFVGADLVALCNEAAMFALRRYIACKRSSRLAVDQYNMDQLPHCSGRSVSSQDNSLSFGGPLDSVSLSLSKMVLSPNHCSSGSENVLECNSTLGMIYPQDCVSLEDSMFKVTVEDFEKAKSKVRPSAMREVMLELPKVCWDDVGGQMEIKKQLIEAVQWPQMNPDAFRRIGICPPRGLLLFGPPGCSKTLMARAVASEAKLNFLAVKGPELFSKWVGESEKAVRSLFAKARANSPSIIFFDEIDGLAVTRGQDNDGTSVADRVLSQLLVELDGLDQIAGVTVIAATNRPDKIDPALLRSGRFDRHLDVKPPNAFDRQAIFHIHMRGTPCSGDVTVRDLACLTDGYTGADIKLICREAAIAALEESFETSEISMKHFKMAIGRVQPTDTGFYLKISEKFRRYVDTGEARDR